MMKKIINSFAMLKLLHQYQKKRIKKKFQAKPPKTQPTKRVGLKLTKYQQKIVLILI